MSRTQKKDFNQRVEELRLYLTPRFLIGLGLIISALFALLLIRANSDRWTSVLSATRSLAPGAVVSEGDFTTVEIRVREGIENYLAESAPIIGATVLREIGDGELIPRRAVTSAIDPTIRRVALSLPSAELPIHLQSGEVVDIYSLPSDRLSPRGDIAPSTNSQLLLAGVGIDGFESKDRDFGGNSTITFLIPDRLVERVLNASVASKIVIVRR